MPHLPVFVFPICQNSTFSLGRSGQWVHRFGRRRRKSRKPFTIRSRAWDLCRIRPAGLSGTLVMPTPCGCTARSSGGPFSHQRGQLLSDGRRRLTPRVRDGRRGLTQWDCQRWNLFWIGNKGARVMAKAEAPRGFVLRRSWVVRTRLFLADIAQAKTSGR